MSLTAEQIKARLTIMCAASDDPVLTSDELDILVEDYGQDLLGAAAEGWRWKAARVVSRYDFSDATSSFSRDQLHKHCLEMVAMYDKGITSVVLEPETLFGGMVGGNTDGSP